MALHAKRLQLNTAKTTKATASPDYEFSNRDTAAVFAYNSPAPEKTVGSRQPSDFELRIADCELGKAQGRGQKSEVRYQQEALRAKG